jgi:hypothetical protein
MARGPSTSLADTKVNHVSANEAHFNERRLLSHSIMASLVV